MKERKPKWLEHLHIDVKLENDHADKEEAKAAFSLTSKIRKSKKDSCLKVCHLSRTIENVLRHLSVAETPKTTNSNMFSVS